VQFGRRTILSSHQTSLEHRGSAMLLLMIQEINSRDKFLVVIQLQQSENARNCRTSKIAVAGCRVDTGIVPDLVGNPLGGTNLKNC